MINAKEAKTATEFAINHPHESMAQDIIDGLSNRIIVSAREGQYNVTFPMNPIGEVNAIVNDQLTNAGFEVSSADIDNYLISWENVE